MAREISGDDDRLVPVGEFSLAPSESCTFTLNGAAMFFCWSTPRSEPECGLVGRPLHPNSSGTKASDRMEYCMGIEVEV